MYWNQNHENWNIETKLIMKYEKLKLKNWNKPMKNKNKPMKN